VSAGGVRLGDLPLPLPKVLAAIDDKRRHGGVCRGD
jgi:hypothetical protein